MLVNGNLLTDAIRQYPGNPDYWDFSQATGTQFSGEYSVSSYCHVPP
jgi:hypothetical protein